MRKLLIGIAVLAALSITSSANADAGERTMTGVAIGAGTGAIVAGPIGAVAGGVIGAVIGGPRLSRSSRHCRYDRRGHRHCHWH